MKETQRFYSSLGLLIILNVIIKPLWILGIDRQVQNETGTAAYGAYFSLLNFSILFSFLLDWGLTAFFNRQLAARKEEFSSRARQFFFIKLVFSALYVLAVCTVALLTGISDWKILGYVITVQVLSSLFLFFRSIITAQQWFITDAWLSVLDKTLMILLCGSFLYAPAVAGGITVEKFLVTQVACTLAAIAVSVFILLRKGFQFSKTRTVFPAKKILVSALPYAAIVLLMSVHYRLDGFLLRQMKDAHEAGIYAGAYRILDAANMVGYLTASFLLPFIARQRENKNEINPVILASRHLLIVFSLATAVIVFFLAPWIQQVLYYNTDVNAIDVLQWCLPALIGYSLVQVYGTVLTATGHIVPFCYITLVAVLLNAGLNIWLIPDWGAKGSCIAALVSQGFCGIATLAYAKKKCGVPIHFLPVLMYIFIGAALCGFLYWSGQQRLDVIVQIAGALLITISITLASGLFPAARWKKLFSQPD